MFLGYLLPCEPKMWWESFLWAVHLGISSLSFLTWYSVGLGSYR